MRYKQGIEAGPYVYTLEKRELQVEESGVCTVTIGHQGSILVRGVLENTKDHDGSHK